MSGDIEEFLRRAAQRRQAKAAQTPPPPAAATRRPEYTTARTERMPRNRTDEEIPVAAILLDDEDYSEPVAKHVQVLDQQRQRAERADAARRAGGTVKPVPVAIPEVAYAVPERQASLAPQTITTDGAGFSVADRLITMLRQPDGLMQAILLKEILQRPEERW